MSDLPPGWELTTLGAIAESVKNGIFVSRPGKDPHGVPILRIGSVRPTRLDIKDVRYSALEPTALAQKDALLRSGDLLFTRYSGNPEYVGACALVPDGIDQLTYPDKLIRVRVDARAADPRFVAWVFSWEGLRAQVRSVVKTTAGQVGISGRDLRSIQLPLPPLAEQHRIVSALDAHLSRLDAGIAGLVSLGRRIASLSWSISHSATVGWFVNGRITFPTRPVGEVTAVQGGIQKQPKRRPIKNRCNCSGPW